MIIRKNKDITEQDLGATLGRSEIGIRSKLLFGETNGNCHDEAALNLKYLSIEPGQFYPPHTTEFPQVTFIISGKGTLADREQKVNLEEGDLFYTNPDEIHSVINTGHSLLKLLTIGVPNFKIRLTKA
jgi:quercetin dioxygenase-like cupin family protein